MELCNKKGVKNLHMVGVSSVGVSDLVTSDEKEPIIYITDNEYRPDLNVGGELVISLYMLCTAEWKKHQSYFNPCSKSDSYMSQAA